MALVFGRGFAGRCRTGYGVGRVGQLSTQMLNRNKREGVVGGIGIINYILAPAQQQVEQSKGLRSTCVGQFKLIVRTRTRVFIASTFSRPRAASVVRLCATYSGCSFAAAPSHYDFSLSPSGYNLRSFLSRSTWPM